MLSLLLQGWQKDPLKPWSNRELLLQYNCRKKDEILILPTAVLYYPRTQCWLVDLATTHCIVVGFSNPPISASNDSQFNCYRITIPYHILNNTELHCDPLQVAVILQSTCHQWSHWNFPYADSARPRTRFHVYVPKFVKQDLQIILLVLPQRCLKELQQRVTCIDKPVQPFDWKLEMQENYRQAAIQRLTLVRMVLNDVSRIALSPCDDCLGLVTLQRNYRALKSEPETKKLQWRSSFHSLHRNILVIPHSSRYDIQNWWCVQQNMTELAIDTMYCAFREDRGASDSTNNSSTVLYDHYVSVLEKIIDDAANVVEQAGAATWYCILPDSIEFTLTMQTSSNSESSFEYLVRNHLEQIHSSVDWIQWDADVQDIKACDRLNASSDSPYKYDPIQNPSTNVANQVSSAVAAIPALSFKANLAHSLKSYLLSSRSVLSLPQSIHQFLKNKTGVHVFPPLFYNAGWKAVERNNLYRKSNALLISVIIIVPNANNDDGGVSTAQQLQVLLQSLCEQTYNHTELIVLMEPSVTTIPTNQSNKQSNNNLRTAILDQIQYFVQKYGEDRVRLIQVPEYVNQHPITTDTNNSLLQLQILGINASLGSLIMFHSIGSISATNRLCKQSYILFTTSENNTTIDSKGPTEANYYAATSCRTSSYLLPVSETVLYRRPILQRLIGDIVNKPTVPLNVVQCNKLWFEQVVSSKHRVHQVDEVLLYD